MSGFWMVRAGEGGYLIEEFENAGYVGIGWQGAGDFSEVQTIEEMRDIIVRAFPDAKPGALGNSASMAYKFRHSIQPGDHVISYNPQKREYLWEVDGRRRILNPAMSHTDRALVLLHSSHPQPVTEPDLFEWCEYSDASAFRSQVLKKAHKERFIEYDAKKQLVYISPKGIERAEKLLLSYV